MKKFRNIVGRQRGSHSTFFNSVYGVSQQDFPRETVHPLSDCSLRNAEVCFTTSKGSQDRAIWPTWTVTACVPSNGVTMPDPEAPRGMTPATCGWHSFLCNACVPATLRKILQWAILLAHGIFAEGYKDGSICDAPPTCETD